VDKVMWASDFPHLESDWPNSRKVMAENFAKSTEDEVWKMTVVNALKYFHLNDQ
jgi:predicted TIM-barrel fold metal-dependent hydrolase